MATGLFGPAPPPPSGGATTTARTLPDARVASLVAALGPDALERVVCLDVLTDSVRVWDHSFTPGERCEACNVVCACSAFDASLAGLEPNGSSDTPVESDAEDDLAGVDLVGDFSTYEYGSDEDQAHDVTPLRGDV